MTNENVQYKQTMLALEVGQEMEVPANVGVFLKAAEKLLRWPGKFIYGTVDGVCTIKRTE